MTTNSPSDLTQGRWLTRRAGIEARPYFAQTSDDQPEQGWPDDEVHIFCGDVEIGCYKRPYEHLGSQTFEPFERDGRWYALYSSDYTCTRVMTLPDCRDIGGEEPNDRGFCPAEIYVPRFRAVRWGFSGTPFTNHRWSFESSAEGIRDTANILHDLGPWQSLDIGFVHGCYWACPFEVQVFDLKHAAKGIIPRDSRFGPIELSNLSLALASLVRLERSLPGPLKVTFATDITREVPID